MSITGKTLSFLALFGSDFYNYETTGHAAPTLENDVTAVVNLSNETLRPRELGEALGVFRTQSENLWLLSLTK